MLSRLGTFLHAHRRRVLFVSVLGAAVAGVFGSGVAKHLSPYGANDPATQSVQATGRYENATGRQIDPGIVAVVRTGDVHAPAARARAEAVARTLRTEPDVATVASYWSTRDPAMVSQDRRSTYVVAYFKSLSDSRIKDDAVRLE